MCLLALFFRVAEDCPVVAGAIREEYFARGGEPPRLRLCCSAEPYESAEGAGGAGDVVAVAVDLWEQQPGSA